MSTQLVIVTMQVSVMWPSIFTLLIHRTAEDYSGQKLPVAAFLDKGPQPMMIDDKSIIIREMNFKENLFLKDVLYEKIYIWFIFKVFKC